MSLNADFTNVSTAAVNQYSTSDIFNMTNKDIAELQEQVGGMKRDVSKLHGSLFKAQEDIASHNNTVNLTPHFHEYQKVENGSAERRSSTSQPLSSSQGKEAEANTPQNGEKQQNFPSPTGSRTDMQMNKDATPQSQVFKDDSKFSSSKFSLEAGHFSRSNEDISGAATAPEVKEEGKIHYEIIARSRRRPSMEKDMKFGISCQQTKNEDAYRVIPFKVLNQGGRRNSVISFTRVQDSSEGEEEEQPPLKKARKLDEISRANEELEKAQSKENTASVATQLNVGGANYAFFGVYDGHGGPQAAEYVRQNLHGKIVEHPNFKEDPEAALIEGFHKVEDGFINELCAVNRNIHGVGTTAVVALIATTNSATTLYVAHVGDSEAMVCRNGAPLILTEPHNVKNQKEKDRIISCGGIIYKDRLAHPKFNPSFMNIAVSRAIGDLYFKSDEYTEGKASGLIAEPQVTKLELTTDDEFVILASDGFWDVISKEKAIEFVKKHPKDYDANLLCKELTDLAFNERTADDTTVLLVKLRSV